MTGARRSHGLPRRRVIGLAAAGGLLAAEAPAQHAVDLALVLAIDCSLSIDDSEFRLQIEGTARAIVHPAVLRAMRGGERRSIALTYVQWAGPHEQVQAIGWTLIDSEAAAHRFAAALRSLPRPFRGDATSLGAAIDYCRTIVAAAPFAATRRTVDISGDGINNAGRLPSLARDAAIADGLTVNGLPILSEIGGLDRYFREEVIGGPGSFVIAAQDFESFAQAIRAKLIREIA